MYAVIEDGGKQYRVSEGDRVFVERRNVLPGEEVAFERVLLLSKEGDVRVGRPVVEGAQVSAVVEGERRHKKVTIMRFRRRKGSHIEHGHRQTYTTVRIRKIVFPA